MIKVESAVRPDSSRGSPQPDSQVGDQPWNNGGMYHEANRNKLGISLDLNTDRGKELFKELVSVSDVVAQNFPPRVMRNFGLDYPELRKIKSDIIRSLGELHWLRVQSPGGHRVDLPNRI